jgi:hypothetical protein
MVKITIIGNHTNISDSLIIIPAGGLIGRGITVVYIQRFGIRGIGVLHTMSAIHIILTIGDIGILILVTEDTVIIIIPGRT